MLCMSKGVLDRNCIYIYRSQTKLREGNVFTCMCHSIHRGVSVIETHLLDIEPYWTETPWTEIPLGQAPLFLQRETPWTEIPRLPYRDLPGTNIRPQIPRTETGNGNRWFQTIVGVRGTHQAH